MERRRLGVVLAGLLIVGGTVAVLRATGGTTGAPGRPPALPTALRAYAAPGVVLPSADAAPPAPANITVTAGPRRLQLVWPVVVGAVGYQVDWPGGSRLVAEPAARITGLSGDRDVRVQVRSVDAFGQRSAPVAVSGRPAADSATSADYSFVDRFDGAAVPDPRFWQLTAPSGCARVSPGPDGLLVTGQCSNDLIALRARTPFLLGPPGPDGVLGRFSIDTTAPSEDGLLDLDFVPGPVDLLGNSPDALGLPATPVTAVDDPALPPGAIRVRIAANVVNDQPTASVTVLVAPDTPRITPGTGHVFPLPTPRLGAAARWDVLLTTTGIRVLRNGILVGGGIVVPQWTQAAALVGLAGPNPGQLRADVSLIAFGGAPAATPRVTAGPEITAPASVGPAPDNVTQSVTDGDQLRLTVLGSTSSPTGSPTPNRVIPAFQVEIAGRRFAATPAIPGFPLSPQVDYPLVAEIPRDLLRTGGSRSLSVLDTAPAGSAVGQFTVVTAELDTGTAAQPPLPTQPAVLGVLTAQLDDASGDQLPTGQPAPRGRLLLDVTVDGPAGQRRTGQIAGLAGFQAWLDGVELAAVPTTVDGPGIAGDWRVAFDTMGLTAGAHTIEVRALGTDHTTAPAETYLNFSLP